MNKLSVIVPCFNEGYILNDTHETLHDFFLCSKKFKGEIVFVDDGSTDDTLTVLRDIERAHANVKVLSYPTNKGKGHAVRLGLLGSKYFTKVVLDADLSIGIYNADRINFRERWHIVKGRRRFIKFPMTRRITSWGWHNLVRLHVGLKYDTQAPFTILRVPRTFYRSSMTIDGFAYDVEILKRARLRHYRIKELDVPYEYQSDSKVTFSKTLRMIRELRTIR
jgi:glycosyltransferase involved in cell wall biosynthesis